MARLARPWATTAPGGQLGRPRQGGVERRALGDDPVDQPDAQRLLGADLAAGEDQVLGPGRADEAGQPLGAAAAGDDAEQDLGLAEPGRCRRDPEVARQRQLAAAAEGEAVRPRRSSPAGWRPRR